MTDFSKIHAASAAVIAGQTYAPYNYPSPSQLTQLRGVGLQVPLATPEYEIGVHMLANGNQINFYTRTGADSYQQTTGYGNVVCRTFYKDLLAFGVDRTVVYAPVDWAVFEHCEYIINGKVWMFTTERLRADTAQIRVMVQISTDGLAGRSFGTPIAVSSGGTAVTDNLLYCAVPITDNTGKLWIYFSCESPTGLYRIQVNPAFDGTFTGYAKVSSQTMSEACVADVDGAGKLVCVYRAGTATYLQQMTSSNYGATWTAGVSTGLGLSNGTKVQPRIIESADPLRFIVAFSDRAAQQYDRVVPLVLKTSAFANSYRSAVQLWGGQTNGNGDIIVLDAAKRLYLIAATNSASNNAANGISWGVFADSTATGRRPWQ
ncbi:exo-alpha-sialidase [Herbaspirillum sp. RU 5E]|nr:exo-alpha-sialidase [Herbaspirillum sp. RU 5E]